MRPARRGTAAALLALALAGPAAVAAVPSAGAAAPQCQGRDATIVGGVNDNLVTGTEGDDVIVTDGSNVVRALGGDDVVCSTQVERVEAGDGDDDVEVSGYVGDVVLGAGSDELSEVTTPGRETTIRAVWTGTGSLTTEPVDGDPDVVDVRGDDRSDSADVYAGQDGRALDDVIRLDGPYHAVYLRGTGMTPDAVLAGEGSYLSWFGPDDDAAWSISLAAGTASSDSGTFRWSGMRSQVGWYDTGSVTATGTSGDDSISGPVVGASMGGGDDWVFVERSAIAAPTTRIDGGTGRDMLFYRAYVSAVADADAVSVDVPTRTGRFRSLDGSEAITRFAGFESYRAESRSSVRLRGGPGAETLTGESCDLDIHGGGGPDRITNARYVYAPDGPRSDCDDLRAHLSGEGGNDVLTSAFGRIEGRGDGIEGGTGDDRIVVRRPAVRVLGGPGNDLVRVDREEIDLPGVTANGGPGNDRLLGARGPDTLVGGDGRDLIVGKAGRDTANGGPGVDRCQSVERRTSCERS